MAHPSQLGFQDAA
uniref:Cytochrome c oxidase subunit II n=2 Tax=Neopterygii TaxID=41665 RepID=Q8HMN1_ATRSP|nr:cytochrome c oxidase subunit II [Atractosteus spatula]